MESIIVFTVLVIGFGLWQLLRSRRREGDGGNGGNGDGGWGGDGNGGD